MGAAKVWRDDHKTAMAEGNGIPLPLFIPSKSALMNRTKIEMAPSLRRPFNGTGVRRIPGGKLMKTRKIRMGTWNVRGMKKHGKLSNIILEMERLNIDILGLSETKWTGQNKYESAEGKILYYSGNDQSFDHHGVGILMSKEISKSVTKFIPLSNRAMLIQMSAVPANLNIIQVYAPTADKPLVEIEEFYGQVEILLQHTKKHDINLIMGDLNAKVGCISVPGVTGDYGLGDRNDRGDTLIEFCQENELMLANTFFKLHPRRLYTWTSPQHTANNIVRNQIDYIIINKRFRNSIKNCLTYPGADIKSDHNPVVATLHCKFKNLAKQKQQNYRIDLRKMKEPIVKAGVSTAINEWADKQLSHPPSAPLETWSTLKDTVRNICQTFLRPDLLIKKQQWMTDEILNLMTERQKYKTTDPKKYNELDKLIARKIKTCRETFYVAKCERIEDLLKLHDGFNLHKEIKDLAGLNKSRKLYELCDDQGNLLHDLESKKETWNKYIIEMFKDASRSPASINITDDSGPPILTTEVKKALRSAKTGKAMGPDNIPVEVLKLLEDDYLDALTNLFNQVYNLGSLPSEWLKSTFITLPKKTKAKKCAEYRTISLMSHVLKIFLAIIQNRIRPKCDEQLGESQFGFRSGMGTREALFALNVLVQKCKDMQTNVILCFIDYEKAFDRVRHDLLMERLLDVGLDSKDLRVIKNLYWNQRATVRVERSETEEVEICRGVRQGCVLSPLLFNLYSEAIMSEALEGLEIGVKINGKVVNNLRYADDTVLIASSEKDLQILVNRVSECSLKAGLSINVSKTKFLVASGNRDLNPKFQVGGTDLERVRMYKYLGAWVNEEWDCEQEIRTRIEIARACFKRMDKVLCSRNLSIKLRVRMLHCYVWPVVFYGSEAWTLKADTQKRLEAFEMWCYRKMLRIGWTKKVSNVKVLQRVARNRELLPTIKKRKVEYLGHVLRHERYQLLQLIMMGKVAGKRRAGRRKKSWLHNIREWTNIASVEQLFRLAKDRIKFAELTANLQ